MTADRIELNQIFCASSAEAQLMSDDLFWLHVFRTEGHFVEEEYNPDHESMDDFLGVELCPVCGASGACAWDMEGLPLVHPKPKDDTYEVSQWL